MCFVMITLICVTESLRDRNATYMVSLLRRYLLDGIVLNSIIFQYAFVLYSVICLFFWLVTGVLILNRHSSSGTKQFLKKTTVSGL